MRGNPNRGLRRKVRAAYAISTVSVSLVLFLLGTVGYLILNAVSATDRMKESVTVNVMLREGLSDAEGALGERISALENVLQVEYVSREQAAEEFRQYVEPDFERFLGENPLPCSYRVRMTSEGSDGEALEEFERTVAGWGEVDEVVYHRSVIDRITSNIRRFILVLLFFGGTLMVIAVVLLGNTIRAAIYSKRYLINTMKLVGATRGFILRPFMRDSVLQGLFAAMISSAMFLIMIVGLREGVPELALVAADRELAMILGGMFAGGILFSLLFTTLAVNKFINMRAERIHLY